MFRAMVGTDGRGARERTYRSSKLTAHDAFLLWFNRSALSADSRTKLSRIALYEFVNAPVIRTGIISRSGKVLKARMFRCEP